MGTSPQGDEELGAVGIRATVSHAQQPVIGGESLICKDKVAKCGEERTPQNPVDA